MTPDEKQQKTALKTLFKKMLKSHAHIVILQDDVGKISMFTNMVESKDIAYTLTYMANDLLGKVDDFDKEVKEQVGKAMKDRESADIDAMAEQFIKEGKVDTIVKGEKSSEETE